MTEIIEIPNYMILQNLREYAFKILDWIKKTYKQNQELFENLYEELEELKNQQDQTYNKVRDISASIETLEYKMNELENENEHLNNTFIELQESICESNNEVNQKLQKSETKILKLTQNQKTILEWLNLEET